MLDLGWSEILVVAIVLIVVVGPKDLPKMLRAFGKTTKKMRGMANDFRRQFDDALAEAELDEVRSTLDDVRKLNPTNAVKEALQPLREAGESVKRDIDDAKRGIAGAATGAAAVGASSAKADGGATGASTPKDFQVPEPTIGLGSGGPDLDAVAREEKAKRADAAKAEAKPASKSAAKPAAKPATKPKAVSSAEKPMTKPKPAAKSKPAAPKPSARKTAAAKDTGK